MKYSWIVHGTKFMNLRPFLVCLYESTGRATAVTLTASVSVLALQNVKVFYASVASARLGHRVFGLSVRVYVHPSIDQVKNFVQGRISRTIYDSKLIFHMRMYLTRQQEYTRAITSWPIFHGPLISDFGQIINIQIFVQGRMLSFTNGSKLIFPMRSANFRLWPIIHG